MTPAADFRRETDWQFLLALAVAFSAGLLICWPTVRQVWTTGVFFDSDDAMRMVQVRDWMAGQAWFDLMPHRLGFPGAGVETHWTRVVDVPIAALVWGFSGVLGPVAGERAARIAFSLLLQLALLTAVGLCARRLAGRAATAPALLICALSGAVLIQFQPGRIDHHAPQIVILLLAVLAALRSIDSARPGTAGFASGALMALSLSISLENLPMIAGVAAMFAIAWVVDGDRRARALCGFGLGLATCLAPLLAVTTPPDRWFAAACDAGSVAHLTLAVAGCAICFILAAAGRRPLLSSPARRLAAVFVGGAALAGLLVAAFPACAGDPYGAVDPLVRRLWLDTVREAMPLRTALSTSPALVAPMLLSALIGIASMAAAVVSERGAARLRWSFALAVASCALATTMWKIIAISPLLSLAGLGIVWPLLRMQRFLVRRGSAIARVSTILCALPFSTLAMALATPGGPSADADARASRGSACTAPEAFAHLASLPRGLIFSPINFGAHLLAWTPHAVLAGPYHRNNAGNRAVLEGFLADPEAARVIVAASGAEYLVYCRGDLEAFADLAPDGLAGRLMRGEPPGWLRPEAPETVGKDAYTIYRVQR